MSMATRERLLRFASQLATDQGEASARAVAVDRNWIDASGRVTRDGAQLVEALDGQMGTRSVFR